MLRFKLVLYVILNCIKRGTNPWYYFQLNANWFNNKKGIFSKLEIDQYIPEQWRLAQSALTSDYHAESFPLFLKPEWGQNSNGIIKVNDAASWSSAVSEVDHNLSYIVQAAATGTEEYEVFYVRDADDLTQFVMFSITKADNNENTEYPINSINNSNTIYTDCTAEFDAGQQQQLWNMLSSIGEFRIARVCCRCDDQAGLVAGKFQIVEINLFVPMPLTLMDPAISDKNKDRFLRIMGDNLSRLIKNIPADQPYKGIFFRKWALHRKMLS